MNDLIWSFAPWLIFLLATRITSLSGAIALGLVASLIVSARAFGHHHFHLLDGASLVYFIGLGIALEAVHPGSTQYWSRYAQAGAHAFLTLIVLGSVAIGRPFTESYAREQTSESVWNTPRFHALNRKISAVWGLAFLVGTASLIVAGSVSDRQFLLRVVIPFGALAWAYSFTQRTTAARRADGSASGSGTAAGSDSGPGMPGPGPGPATGPAVTG